MKRLAIGGAFGLAVGALLTFPVALGVPQTLVFGWPESPLRPWFGVIGGFVWGWFLVVGALIGVGIAHISRPRRPEPKP